MIDKELTCIQNLNNCVKFKMGKLQRLTRYDWKIELGSEPLPKGFYLAPKKWIEANHQALV